MKKKYYVAPMMSVTEMEMSDQILADSHVDYTASGNDTYEGTGASRTSSFSVWGNDASSKE